jgi:hypothetical protein
LCFQLEGSSIGTDNDMTEKIGTQYRRSLRHERRHHARARMPVGIARAYRHERNRRPNGAQKRFRGAGAAAVVRDFQNICG